MSSIVTQSFLQMNLASQVLNFLRRLANKAMIGINVAAGKVSDLVMSLDVLVNGILALGIDPHLTTERQECWQPEQVSILF